MCVLGGGGWGGGGHGNSSFNPLILFDSLLKRGLIQKERIWDLLCGKAYNIF